MGAAVLQVESPAIAATGLQPGESRCVFAADSAYFHYNYRPFCASVEVLCTMLVKMHDMLSIHLEVSEDLTGETEPSSSQDLQLHDPCMALQYQRLCAKHECLLKRLL